MGHFCAYDSVNSRILSSKERFLMIIYSGRLFLQFQESHRVTTQWCDYGEDRPTLPRTQQLSPDCYNLVDPSDLRTIPITTRHIKITSKAARTDSYVLTRLETIIHPTHFHLETEQCHLHILSQVDHTCLFIDISNTVCLFSSTNALFLIGSKRICYRAHLSYAQHVCHQSPSFSKGNISLTPWCCVSTYLFSKRCLCVSCAIERSLVLCNVCEERQIETGRK